jgi:hypothetical protein
LHEIYGVLWQTTCCGFRKDMQIYIVSHFSHVTETWSILELKQLSQNCDF